MGEAEVERAITLLRASWAFFDGVAARVSAEMRKGDAVEDATATGSSATPSASKARTSRRESGCGSRRAAALTPDGLREVSAGLCRRDARVQRRRARAALCGCGRYRSSSGTLPSTRSTMPGRWRTRTSPFRKQADLGPPGEPGHLALDGGVVTHVPGIADHGGRPRDVCGEPIAVGRRYERVRPAVGQVDGNPD